MSYTFRNTATDETISDADPSFVSWLNEEVLRKHGPDAAPAAGLWMLVSVEEVAQ